MWHLNLATQYYGNMNEAQQGIFEGAAGTLTLEFSSQVGLQLANYRKKPQSLFLEPKTWLYSSLREFIGALKVHSGQSVKVYGILPTFKIE